MTFLTFVFVVVMATASVSGQGSNCDDPFDLFFILDGSDSLSDENFRDMKRFVINVISDLNIAIGNVHVGALVYGSEVYSKIGLQGRDESGRLTFDILTLSRIRGGFTETDKAIAEMRQEFTANGRSGLAKVCVVITDGKSLYPEQTASQSALARNESIHMIALGFGSNIFMEELKAIASNDDIAFNTSDFNTAIEAATENAIRDAVCVPRSPPVNIRATPLSADSVLIQWDEPPAPHGNIQGYRIYYTIDSSQNIALWSSLSVSSDLRTATITGLIFNRVYHVKMLAYSSNGDGPLSDCVQVLTNTGGPGSAPRNVRARPLNQQTIMVEWEEPEIPNGALQGYKIFYTTDSSQMIALWNSRDVGSSFRMATIGGLTADSIYTIRMLAYSAAGQGPLSVPVKVLTNAGAPGSAPRNIRVVSYSSQTLMIEWDVPDIPNGAIQGYRVYYTTDQSEPVAAWNVQDVSGGITVATISGLVSERTYTFRILAYSSAGQGPLSESLQFMTFTNVPGSAPRNVRVVSATSSTIILEWDLPAVSNGAIQGYRVYYTTDQSQPIATWNMQNISGGNRMATITGLTADTTYIIRVLAYSSTGNGPLSGQLQVRTNTGGLVTTTAAPVTTPGTGGLNGNLNCDDCMVSESLGFLQYPGYCGKFIQIFADSQGQRTSTTMKCRAGLFWDNQAMTCRRPHEVQCEYDICLTKPVGYTYSIDHLCSGYITCIGGRSHGACCGVNERWAAGTGCVFDPTCRDACDREDDNRIVYPHVCQSYPIPGDRRNYVEYIEGFGNVTRPCALGTLFNAVDCSCSDLDPQPPAGSLGGCQPSANFTFVSDFMDTSKEMVYAGTELVNVQGGNAVFNGNGMVNMYRFANAEFKSDLVISFRFQASGAGDATQALLSNCIFSTEFTASIVLKIVPIARTLIMTTDTTNGRRELSFIYNNAGINDVTYIYDGECLRGVVNGNMKQVQLTGHILQRRSGIILGAGSKIGHFTGSIKDFLLYKCMPSAVDVYRAQSCN